MLAADRFLAFVGQVFAYFFGFAFRRSIQALQCVRRACGHRILLATFGKELLGGFSQLMTALYIEGLFLREQTGWEREHGEREHCDYLLFHRLPSLPSIAFEFSCKGSSSL